MQTNVPLVKKDPGFAGALNAARKAGAMGAPRVAPLSVIHTQDQQRIINNSRNQVGGVQGMKKAQYDDLPKRNIQSYKKGGMVHKTGLALLHKGELVVPKHAVDAMHKKWMMSDTGMVSDHTES